MVRQVIKAAGPNVLWVIGGRDDLMRSRQFGSEYFKGYSDDFPRRLLAWDMRQLASDDVRDYFAVVVPQRPLAPQDLEAITRATRGIPLAIREAADIWAGDHSLSEIVGDITDSTPSREIVGKMTERYQLHCINNESDKRALYALALARGNKEILRAMLRPSTDAPFDLDSTLRRLERDYASVHRTEAGLHDEPAAFLLEALKPLAKEEWVQALNDRAIAVLRTSLTRRAARLGSMEERCEDEDWVNDALDLLYYLFWRDQEQAWAWLIPHFVAGQAYNSDLWRGLLQIAREWEPQMTKGERRRLRAFRAVNVLVDQAERVNVLDVLTQIERQGWLHGDDEAELRAILNLKRGQIYQQNKQLDEAVRALERAEQGLPVDGEALKRQLGDAMRTLASSLIWPEARMDTRYSVEAERMLRKVVDWLPEDQTSWYNLAATLSMGNKHEEAITALKRAIELDPQHAAPHNGLGTQEQLRIPGD